MYNEADGSEIQFCGTVVFLILVRIAPGDHSDLIHGMSSARFSPARRCPQSEDTAHVDPTSRGSSISRKFEMPFPPNLQSRSREVQQRARRSSDHPCEPNSPRMIINPCLLGTTSIAHLQVASIAVDGSRSRAGQLFKRAWIARSPCGQEKFAISASMSNCMLRKTSLRLPRLESVHKRVKATGTA